MFYLFKTTYRANGDSRTLLWSGPYSLDDDSSLDMRATSLNEQTTTFKEEEQGDPMLGFFGHTDSRSEVVDHAIGAKVSEEQGRILLEFADPEGSEVTLKRYVTAPHPDAPALAGLYTLEARDTARAETTRTTSTTRPSRTDSAVGGSTTRPAAGRGGTASRTAR